MDGRKDGTVFPKRCRTTHVLLYLALPFPCWNFRWWNFDIFFGTAGPGCDSPIFEIPSDFGENKWVAYASVSSRSPKDSKERSLVFFWFYELFWLSYCDALCSGISVLLTCTRACLSGGKKCETRVWILRSWISVRIIVTRVGVMSPNCVQHHPKSIWCIAFIHFDSVMANSTLQTWSKHGFSPSRINVGNWNRSCVHEK